MKLRVAYQHLPTFLVFTVAVLVASSQVSDTEETKDDSYCTMAATSGRSSLFTWFYDQPVILGVIDGDSIRISAPFLPQPLPSTLILRLRGVDTPEMGWRASCPEESQLATTATNGTASWLQQRTTRIELARWDKYGGRVLGDIIDTKTSERLSDWLVVSGLALVYNGRKRSDWCAILTENTLSP
jgi:endonuclease YncB( thermonuclease family)